MRFSKRPRVARLFGRKTAEPPAPRATPETAAYEPVRNDERDALVSHETSPEDWHDNGGVETASPSMDESGEQKPMSADAGREITLDPTNRLLTALGRFHREVLKAREGGAHDQWPDVCMNQLIGAVEIALSQGWGEVVEALGETGRVLQTYTEAGRSNDSVTFLEDAYEVLCLMVGDLIVGSVREGVVRKWRGRYQEALEDIEAAGLRLVDDDDSPVPAAPEADDAFAMPLEDLLPSPDAPFDGLPALDSLAPLEDEVACEALDGDEDSLVTGLLDTVCEALALVETNPSGRHPAAFATLDDAVETLEREARSASRLGAAVASEVMQRLCASAQQLSGTLDDRFFELAYGFPGLYAEAGDAPADDSVEAWIMECETLLLSWSALADAEEAAAAAESASSLDACELDGAEVSAVEEAEPFGSLGLAALEPSGGPLMSSGHEVPDFGAEIHEIDSVIEAEIDTGEPMEPDTLEALNAAASPIDLSAESPLSEAMVEEAMNRAVEEILNEENEPAAEAAAETVTPFEEVLDTPQQILKVAEQAVSEGRAVNAKLLLLQAAASLAEAEAAEAREALERATRRIQEEAEAIEAAMATAAAAEAAVTDATAAVAGGDDELEARQGRVDAQRGHLESVQSRIDAIEEEIRALEARREEEWAQREQAQQDLAIAEEAVMGFEAELAQRQEVEEVARQRLEEARAQVKQHQRRRTEYEQELEQASSEVRHRAESLTELQQTMSRFGLPATPEEHASGDLFGQADSA